MFFPLSFRQNPSITYHDGGHQQDHGFAVEDLEEIPTLQLLCVNDLICPWTAKLLLERFPESIKQGALRVWENDPQDALVIADVDPVEPKRNYHALESLDIDFDWQDTVEDEIKEVCVR